MRRITIAILALFLVMVAVVACEPPSSRTEAETAAHAWLEAMHLTADGVACDVPRDVPNSQDNGWNACAVRFGGSTQTLWCTKLGCKMAAGFVLPPAASTTKITEAPR